MTVDVNKFDLEKAQRTFDRFLLEKGLNTAPTMRVGAAPDISGSMNSKLTAATRGGDDSQAQRTLNQLMPPALKFDDDGQVDVFTFDNRCDYVCTMDKSNFESYIRANRIAARGGTEYAPVVEAVLRHYFGGTAKAAVEAGKSLIKGLLSKAAPAPAQPTASSGKDPVLMMILTDGDCSDRRATEQALVDSQSQPIYWQFVGVGGASFPTIKYLADKLPNVGDVYLRDFGLSEEEVYRQLVSDELVTWIKRW